MGKFRKKPVVVEAMQFFYDGERVPGVFYPPKSEDGKTYEGDAYVVTIHGQPAYLQNGDWVITEPDGEHHYPCKPDIFEATYELASIPATPPTIPPDVAATMREALAMARDPLHYSDAQIQDAIDAALAWLNAQEGTP